jgi:hypothetical protein
MCQATVQLGGRGIKDTNLILTRRTCRLPLSFSLSPHLLNFATIFFTLRIVLLFAALSSSTLIVLMRLGYKKSSKLVRLADARAVGPRDNICG